MLATTTRRQVVGYVPDVLKEELTHMRAGNARLSESQLIEEALMIALPTLKERHAQSDGPAHAGHRRKHRAA